MRYAILDLGTNTFNLLIVDVQEDKVETVRKEKRSVKLGEGGIQDDIIAKAAQSRAINALSEYRSIVSEMQADEAYCFATSAFRSANNSDEFVALIKQETGFIVNVISGQEEAELIYEGPASSGDIGEENVMIMDIGGGSTEFIIANNKKIHWSRSFDLGAARLLAWLSPDDPIKEEQVKTFYDRIVMDLDPLFRALKLHPCKTILGSSGSFETLAHMLAKREGSLASADELNAYQFNLHEFEKLCSEILASTLQERIEMPGMLRMRADMIVISCMLIQLVQQQAEAIGNKFVNIKLTDAALKEGVVSRIRQNKISWQKS